MDTLQPGRIWPRNLANILELVCDSYNAFEFYPLILAPQSLYSRFFIHLIYPHPHPPSSVHTGCINALCFRFLRKINYYPSLSFIIDQGIRFLNIVPGLETTHGVLELAISGWGDGATPWHRATPTSGEMDP